MSTVTIRPRPLSGCVTPPPSKSQAHRLMICAALAEGVSTLENVAFSQDIEATLGCMEALGARWEVVGEGRIRILGTECKSAGTSERFPRMNCGESGSTLRFLMPLALALAGGGSFTGQGRLMERPQRPYFQLFEEKGVSYRQCEGELTLHGRLEAGEYSLAGDVSSQFITGLLYTLPLLEGNSRIRLTTPLESRGYVDMTLEALRAFGVTITELEDGFLVAGGQSYHPRNLAVEADWSQAGFWLAAGMLGSSVEVSGLNERSIQGDRVVLSYSQRLARPGDVELDVSQCPDLVPPLAAMAAVRQGTTKLVNAARLRLKESDRLSSVTQTLNALGGRVEEHPDSLTIRGVDTLTGGVAVDSCNDHRIAMMAAVAATRCQQPVTVLDAQCVKKSYPNFWEDYRMLGGDFDVLISG